MIKEGFLYVLDSYDIDRSSYNNLLNERKEKKAKGELDPNSSLSKKEYRSFTFLEKNLPTTIKSLANLSSDFQVTGSSGVGYMPEVPHVCVFDISITKSAQHGFYIVYLLNLKTRSVFLSLNQGFTEYSNKYGDKEGKRKARLNAQKAQKLLRSIESFDFAPLLRNTKGRLADGYKSGNICSKEYTEASFPNDTEFADDLRNLIGVYKELKGLVGNSMFQIQDALTEEEYQEELQGNGGIIMENGPIPKKELKVQNKGAISYPRNQSISAQALINSRYTCENNLAHTTFTSHFGHPFVEAHHFIPIEFQESFTFSLDVPENIISLCPNCHRAFHHSDVETSGKMIDKFWGIRKDLLDTRGILIDVATLKSYYSRIKK